MDHAKLLLIFATVLQQGSMNKAGVVLGMSASAVSQHIRNLEQYYNIKLLNRSTRSLAPTEAGRKLWGYAEQLQRLIAQTDEMMMNLQSELRGNVVISLPSGYMELLPIRRMIAGVQEKHPQIWLNFDCSDRISDLTHEPIDIAIRTVAPPADLIARHLAQWQLMICASPGYLAKNPIDHRANLLHQCWLNFNDNILLNVMRELELPPVLPEKRINCSVAEAHHLVVEGMGIGIFLSGYADPLIQQGKLVQLLQNIMLPSKPIYAVTTHRNPSAKVSAVLSELKIAFEHKK